MITTPEKIAFPLDLEILDRSIPHQFHTQVLRYGDRLAIQDEKRSLTYAELNGLANQIAREILEKRGLGAEPIAILLATGVEAIAVMLGVLKAGKFYVPLDITWPESRIATILEDSQSQLIVSDRQQAINLDLKALQKDIFWLDDRDRQCSSENLDIPSTPEDLAYILYTSGSSGRPKGVMQNHRYVLNLYRNYSNSGKMTASDRFSLLYSAAFGGAVRDIYCALLNGAALFPLDIKQVGLHQLGQWLQAKEITIMFAVATLFRHFAATLQDQENFPALRLIQIGSETVYRQDAELFWQHFSDRCTLMVNLGGTEISPIRQFPITHNTRLAEGTIPAGYAVEGTQVQLWDESGQEVPPGEIGEIVVRSRQLASGYWQQPELTQKVFIRDKKFVYFKTGDLGRLLSDGCLLHLGRKDFQVKIRGYRVEIGEIESILVDLEAVREAVVAARTDAGESQSDRRLVAYLTPKNPQNKPNSQYLKEQLAKRLPDYAIPSTFLWLESLPLTATGKIDRRSLPQPPSLSPPDLAIIPPQTPMEEKLAQIWSEVLKLPEIGRENNLFALGGNSLHASQILARIAEQFEIALPLKTIFAAPTIAQFTHYLNSSPQETTLPPLISTPNPERIPLSLPQERLWFLDRLATNPSIYNLLRGFRLQGRINITCLQKALEEIVTRHDILRTTFPEIDGIPEQKIEPSFPVNLKIVNLQDLASEQQNLRVREIIAEMQSFVFHLTRLPLFKCVLIQLSDREHHLLFSFHHIIADDWSIQVFLKELSTLYKIHLHSRPSLLPPLPIQYADYTHWQQQYFTGEASEKQLEYWRSQLAESPPLLELPADFPRTSTREFQSGIVPLKIDRATTQKLQALSRRSQTTLFVTLLTALAVLLARDSNQKDIVIGTAIANRNPVVTEKLIGFFVSTLALRIKVTDNPTFLHLLHYVSQTVLDAHSHADLPFDRLVESLQIERHPHYTPIFQVLFVLQNISQETLLFPETETEAIDLHKPTAGANFDLTLSLQEREGELVGRLEYNAHLFTSETSERMGDRFRRLVEAIAHRPEEKIASYSLLSPEEQHKILVEWNRTEREYPRHTCIQALFEEQVTQNPDAIALIFPEETLTYQELNQKANRLAHYLQTLGVGNESLVGVCLERSPQFIIALLGIIKAGGAYLPLDPTYPGDRLALMVADAGLEIVLSEKSLRKTLPQILHYLDLEERAEEIANYSPENAIVATPATALAYVMYTSGSTGKPKGVSVTHRNIVRLVKNTNYASFNADDTFLQLASISFDAATWEIWGSLLNGARLVLFPERQPSLATLGRILQQHRVTALWLTAGLFHLIVDERLSDLKSLRLLMAGGDTLSSSHVAKCRQALPHCQLVNGYGPTENTTFTCCYSIPSEGAIAESIPIGRPIANTRVYILDPQNQPVPIGVTGELYTGGDGVARGYLNRPELNAERFRESPFVEGDRLYRTGDLARYLPDGNIEFLGRIDRQVKIRGFRIELGEIEGILGQHPQVQQAIVIVGESDTGDKSLIAYAIAREASTNAEELQHFLQQRLPDYLQPEAIVCLERFPLTANGKVDRRALPPPQSQPSQKRAFVPPRTETETLIVQAMGEVLNRKSVGIFDNFFAVGGHSLAAIKLISRVQAALSIELPVQSLFECPTAAALAASISDRQPKTLPKILPATAEGQPLPLSFAQTRLWFLARLEAVPSATYNITLALKMTGPLNIPALERGLQEILRRHGILRIRIRVINGIPYQIVTPAPEFALQVQTADNLSSERLQELAAIEAETPFNLERDLPIRASLWQESPNEGAFFLTLHHIVSDGWSLELLLQELSSLYEAFTPGNPSPLPDLPAQYPDYALWQRQWLTGDVLQTQLDYWKKQLVGLDSPLDLPSDRPRPAVQTFKGARVPLQLEVTLSQKLHTLARDTDSTLFMVLLTAFAILLSRYSDREDIPIGIPVANRQHPQTEPLIGFFVNTLVLRTRIAGNPSFSDLLAQVKQMALDAYSHQDLPFDKMVEALQPKRSASYSPLFQVLFALEPIPSLGNFPGLTLTPIKGNNQTAKFDLTLSIADGREGITGYWEYNRDLFDSTTIERMAGCWQTLLTGIVAAPATKVKDLPLLRPEERQQLLVEWNQTQKDWGDSDVLALFARQAGERPEKIALQHRDRQLTYRELNEQSDRLARYLQSLGVKAETLVGICLERSPAMVVALWGILKAGGAYVPIAPTAPPERMTYILQDTQLSFLLTRSHLAEKFSLGGVRPIDMDGDWQNLPLPDFPSPELPRDRLAYVIYTSGSTGRPKGVEICHPALMNYTLDAIATYEIVESDRLLQFFSLSFDAAAEEIYPCLCTGGTLVLRTDEMLSGSQKFWQQCREWQISVLNLPTAYWHLLTADLTPTLELPPPLRLVTIGGEAASPSALERWQNYLVRRSLESGDEARPPQLINAYGPTETTVAIAHYRVPLPATLATVPIGKAIANAKFYVLDRQMQPVPIGVPGELYIGGASLARGYLRRPELTAEKFIPNPFGEGRLYQSGDWVRYRPDGNLEFIGRLDNQVKLRGFRIELGEIEAILSQQENVREAVAILHEDSPHRKRLIAYIVPREMAGIQDAIAALKAKLREQLPEYTIPEEILPLPAFPLTVNDKVDRKALPPPPSLPRTAARGDLPTTEIERQIAKIWATHLALDTIARGENFFDLGGTSLLMIRVCDALNQHFQIPLSVVEMFQYPTIRTLADCIRQKVQKCDPEAKIAPRSRDRPAKRSQQRQKRRQHRQNRTFKEEENDERD
ncbi:MAG: amino acid adenylation domain-containing protein [Cyanobacteria bacterium SBLK]|nr:amino acid adenylation domain-containing protein [Cyanobacteria bacterium SBLK]